jgi:hypothetical protein
MIHTRYLELDKTSALLNSNGNYNSTMSLSELAKEELNWWVKALPVAQNSIRLDDFEYCMTTDASPTGWGASHGEKVTRGYWSQDERELHINTLELLAIFNSLCSCFRSLKDIQILVRTDSTTALAYINRQGGCHSLINLKVAKIIWSFCESRNIWVFATYINTKDNVIADRASRSDIDLNDFSLDDSSFILICKKFGTPSIDLFASCHTFKCQRYISWYPDINSVEVDAFTIKWDEYFYAFPPFALIPRVLKKIKSDNAKGIILVPNWKSQAWFPVFKSMVCSKIITLKPNKFSLIYPINRTVHPLQKSLSLLAAVLSGSK